MRCSLPLLLLALGACTTQTMERDAMGLWKDESAPAADRARAREPAPEREPEPEAPRGRVVSIPAEAIAGHTEFVNRASTIFGDAVEINMSREPWLALAGFTVSPDAVSRTNQEDEGRGVLTITLERIRGAAVTRDSVPTVRFGDGLRVVGVDRVVLRFWAQKSVEKPHWFHAVGAGRSAFYTVESQPPREWRGKSVDVRSEIHDVAGEYRFDWSAEAKP